MTSTSQWYWALYRHPGLRLIPERNVSPAWSPDGSQIAFLPEYVRS